MDLLRRAWPLALLALLWMMPLARADVPPPPSVNADEAAIRKVLSAQVEAWNRRDLEGYMAGYWRSPELRFFAGDKVTLGWTPTLERYRKKYQGEGKEMGTLSMSDIEVQVLSPRHAFVRGRWRLAFKEGKESAGLYTLLMERRDEGWRIVHDHSS